MIFKEKLSNYNLVTIISIIKKFHQFSYSFCLKERHLECICILMHLQTLNNSKIKYL